MPGGALHGDRRVVSQSEQGTIWERGPPLVCVATPVLRHSHPATRGQPKPHHTNNEPGRGRTGDFFSSLLLLKVCVWKNRIDKCVFFVFRFRHALRFSPYGLFGC